MTGMPDSETDYMAPPPGVDPHDGRELDLMLGGHKPLAYFSDRIDWEHDVPDFPDADFEPHVRAGRIVMRDRVYTRKMHQRDHTCRDLFYALPGEEWRIDALQAILSRQDEAWSDEDDREVGRLLGYDAAEIQAYLDHEARMEASYRAS
eukprot:NODE_11898_length_456_cov_0.750760_g11875_i0.p2 GENE.NODE_11898_length_456_cov_0.750760_g11875_i0~~NODE_11898_length_456_cov_0.750760_g11875_i0.p2  ORF type:complete len:149 (+),score=9.28 NODE_11898_length_456_cov_0.750760_g11875_i0:3-449(+)